MTKRIDDQLVPDLVPRASLPGVSLLSQWLLGRCGWRAAGELVDASKMVFSVGPHTSNYDFFLGIVVVFAMKLKVSFLGKHTLFRPPLGMVLKAVGGIAVNRTKANGVVEQVANVFRQKEAMILALTPEGTRRAVFPWKTGFMHIAKAANCPVQCVGFDYKKKLIIFGPVFYVSDNVDEQMQTIYQFYANVAGKYPENTLVTERQA